MWYSISEAPLISGNCCHFNSEATGISPCLGRDITTPFSSRSFERISRSTRAKAVLVSAVPPIMVKTDRYPGGLPIDVFDGIRKGTFDNRSQFFKDLTIPFYGYNRDGAVISQGIRDEFWRQGMMGGLKGQLVSIRAFS